MIVTTVFGFVERGHPHILVNIIGCKQLTDLNDKGSIGEPH